MSESLTDEDKEIQEVKGLIKQLLVGTRPAWIQAPWLLVWRPRLGAVLFHFGSFLCFLFRKRRVDCVIFPPLPPASLLFICIRQLEAPGWLVYFYCGDLDTEEEGDSGRFTRKQGWFSHCRSFQTGVFILLSVCVAVECCTSLVNVLLRLCVSPVTLRPSLMLISHPGQPLPAGLWKAVIWPLNATHLQLYCYFVTVPGTKPNKIFKVCFEKGSPNVCSLSEQSSIPCHSQLSDRLLSVEETLLYVTAAPNIHMKIIPPGTWTFIP